MKPRKAHTEKRCINVGTHLTIPQTDALDLLAINEGVTLSEYIRRVLLTHIDENGEKILSLTEEP